MQAARATDSAEVPRRIFVTVGRDILVIVPYNSNVDARQAAAATDAADVPAAAAAASAAAAAQAG